ncbi:DUF6596 domain-containing protein [Paenarthrobacter sp. PH39-S1]|uniref:DUF6596 domain-containing protein n=1 Tax=Paenarthrobacter sp. PH39-S1 TaxID=3046204 RepID=UPI0024BBB9A0|nr:DUF6596 domain-containing protein [Paenarthrobacter sp. PH39-S1]MDJ0358124.1 hypothetical protein [Paenarthrobacter sp. PH39-S1]
MWAIIGISLRQVVLGSSPARRGETPQGRGELVLLADQDRSRWNTAQIAAGRAELDSALALGGQGPYVLQAAVASLHAETPCDWVQLAALYGELAHLTGSPVELNRGPHRFLRGHSAGIA